MSVLNSRLLQVRRTQGSRESTRTLRVNLHVRGCTCVMVSLDIAFWQVFRAVRQRLRSCLRRTYCCMALPDLHRQSCPGSKTSPVSLITVNITAAAGALPGHWWLPGRAGRRWAQPAWACGSAGRKGHFLGISTPAKLWCCCGLGRAGKVHVRT